MKIDFGLRDVMDQKSSLGKPQKSFFLVARPLRKKIFFKIYYILLYIYEKNQNQKVPMGTKPRGGGVKP